MKRLRIFGILSIAIILSLLVLAAPASPAFAATISISPTSGKIGDSVTVTGYDFTTYATNENYEYWAEIYFAEDNASITTDSIDTNVRTYELVGESDDPIDEDGDFIGSFNVPSRLAGYSGTTYDEDVVPGTYYVYITIRRVDQDTSDELYYTTLKGKANFTVTAAGTLDPLSPTSGKAGSDVLISGSGFTASAAIIFKFDSTTLGVKSGDTATRNSGIFISTVTIPAGATAGAHTIYVTISGITVNATFTVTASAALDPLSPATGKAGSEVIISGANFPASTVLVIKFDTTTLTPTSGHTSTTSGGLFLSTVIIPTSATAGAHTITVTADTSSVTATFTVTATAALSDLVPATGAPGTDVIVSGANFMASYPIIFQFDDTNLTPKSGDLNTNTAGIFTSIISVPANATAGDHVITVTVGSTVLTKTFTVTGAPPPENAVLSINTSGDFIGAQIGIGGAGFTPGANVTFKYDDMVVASVTADANGLVQKIFNAPPSMHGVHTITVSDGIHTGTTTFTVESEAPPAPPPLAPEAGKKLEPPITFDWTEVNDESKPVTYDFQIATDEDFTADSIVLKEDGLDESQFVYEEMKGLELATQDAPYYWRVRAVDAAFNESEWSDASDFYISPPGSFPKWALYLIIAVGAVFLFGIGFWLGRRTAFYY